MENLRLELTSEHIEIFAITDVEIVSFSETGIETFDAEFKILSSVRLKDSMYELLSEYFRVDSLISEKIMNFNFDKAEPLYSRITFRNLTIPEHMYPGIKTGNYQDIRSSLLRDQDFIKDSLLKHYRNLILAHLNDCLYQYKVIYSISDPDICQRLIKDDIQLLLKMS